MLYIYRWELEKYKREKEARLAQKVRHKMRESKRRRHKRGKRER